MAKIRRREAAQYLGIAPATLAKWAVTGGGPPLYKISAAVIYDTADLDAWLAHRRREHTSAKPMGKI